MSTAENSVATQSGPVTEEMKEQAWTEGLRIASLGDQFGSPPQLYWARRDDEMPVAGPFASQSEAWAAFPQVQRENVRHRKALEQQIHDTMQGYRWCLISGSKTVAGPFDTQTEALDAVPGVLEQRRAEQQEKLDREKATQRAIEKERLDRTRIPEKYQGKSLETFTAKTESLAAALEAAKSYVSHYPPLRNNDAMVLCGPAGRGKTSIGCAIAHDLAIAGHIVRYVTLPELIEADLSAARGDTGLLAELHGSNLLILDGIGIPASKDAAVRCLAEIVSALTAAVVRSLLDARAPKGENWEPHYRQGAPTLLIADFPDLLSLQKYLGDSAFAQLTKHSWRVLEIS